MEEKIFNVLLEMKQEMVKVDQKIDNLQEEVKENMSSFREEIKESMSSFREEVEENMNSFRKEIKENMSSFREEINQKMKHFSKDMLDTQFVFEDEYGKKIDAIFEYVQFHQKTNLQRFNKINDLEKRVSALERKSV